MIPQGSWSNRDVLIKWAYIFLEIQYEVWVHNLPQILHVIRFSSDCFTGSFPSLWPLWNTWNMKHVSLLFLTKAFSRLPRLQHQQPRRFCSVETAGIVENFLQMFKSLETVFGAYKNGGTFVQENLMSW